MFRGSHNTFLARCNIPNTNARIRLMRQTHYTFVNLHQELRDLIEKLLTLTYEQTATRITLLIQKANLIRTTLGWDNNNTRTHFTEIVAKRCFETFLVNLTKVAEALKQRSKIDTWMGLSKANLQGTLAIWSIQMVVEGAESHITAQNADRIPHNLPNF